MIIAVPSGFLGLMYISATSARFSISGLGLQEIPNPVDALLSRQLDVELYLDIEGHGFVSIPVKSLRGQIYLEDTYMGVVSSTEPFRIPASGTTTTHLTFHLDLTTISLTDIQYVAESITSHNGEVKVGFDGYVEPIILFFPITVPISQNTYTLTLSDAPKISSMYWDTTSVGVGESVGFHVTVENVFRGASINGILDLSVREDVKFGSDVDATVYQFPVQLQPGASKTIIDTFVPYKESSTRGFFLKARWGADVIAEQDNTYPPRLSIIEGRLNLIDVYWTVDDVIVTSCELGEYVKAHITVRAVDGAVDDSIKVKIRKDMEGWLDKDFKFVDFDVSLNKGESKVYTISFNPDEPSGGNLRGYFIEIEGDLSWTMPNTYPPRLTVNAEEEGTPSIVSVWWTADGSIVTEVERGQTIQAHIKVKTVGGDISGSINIRVRKDIPYLPDEDHKIQTYAISLTENQQTELTISFTASDSTSSSFRGYFIQIDFTTWDTSWTMDDTYPPRLTVKAEAPTEGTPSLQNVWWTVNNQVVTQSQQGQTVKAHVRIKALGGSVQGTITVRVRKDIAFLPDEDHKVKSFSITLIQDQVIDFTVIFTASEKSGLTFRGYFIQIDFNSWDTTWTMESSYPPRLKVN